MTKAYINKMMNKEMRMCACFCMPFFAELSGTSKQD